MTYLIRKKDVPIRTSITETPAVLMGRKCIGREDICHTKSELLSLTRYDYRGKFRHIVTNDCDRIYYIIDGEVTNFRVGDEVYQKVTKGDIVFIPKGVSYSWDWGELEYMVINGPAFTPGDDKLVE